MKNNKAVIAALGVICTTAFAGGFDGPSLQVGIGGSSTWANISGAQITHEGADPNGSTSSGSFNGTVALGYSQDMGMFEPAISGLNLAANVFYVIGDQNAGNRTASATNSYTQTTSLNGIKLSNTFGISVEPGWNFSEKALGYLKFAWLNSRLKGTSTYADTGSPPQSFTLSGPSSTTINGFGYGLGTKYLITKNIFAGIDLMGVTYSGANPSYTAPASAGGETQSPTQKINQFIGFASIGYKF